MNGICWSKPTYEEKMRVPPWGNICTYILFVVLTFIFGIFTSSFVFYLFVLKILSSERFLSFIVFCLLCFNFRLFTFFFCV